MKVYYGCPLNRVSLLVGIRAPLLKSAQSPGMQMLDDANDVLVILWNFVSWLPVSAYFAAAFFILAFVIGARLHSGSHAPVIFPLVIGAIFAGFAGWNLVVQVPATDALRTYTGLQDAYVKCDSWFSFLNSGGSTSVLGFVEVGPDYKISSRVRLPRQTCDDLRTFILSGSNEVSKATVRGVGVLTHEAEHVRGVLDEARAQCNATQEADRMATALGASDSVATQFPSLVDGILTPLLSSEYDSPDCVENGPMDRTPGDYSWP